MKGIAGAVALVFIAMCAPADAQDKAADDLKLKKAEIAQYEALTTLVDSVMAGKEPAPADAKLKFHHHFVKSTANVYMPYVLEIDAGRLTVFPVAVYIRAVGKGATAAPAENAKYPFADLYFINDAKRFRQGAGNTVEFSRGMELPPGEFDVYIAITETAPRNRSAGPAKRLVHKETVSVPVLNTGFTTSSIILAKSIEEAPQQLTAAQQLAEPFTLGGYRIAPALTPTFTRAAELLFVFFVYNASADAGGKPDVDVNFLFFRAAESKPFSKAAAMTFNTTTLPAEFNANAGHQLVVGQGIPLESFAPGDYKLQIGVTDKAAKQTIMRDVPFSVAP
jgi:hypothetical protein